MSSNDVVSSFPVIVVRRISSASLVSETSPMNRPIISTSSSFIQDLLLAIAEKMFSLARLPSFLVAAVGRMISDALIISLRSCPPISFAHMATTSAFVIAVAKTDFAALRD